MARKMNTGKDFSLQNIMKSDTFSLYSLLKRYIVTVEQPLPMRPLDMKIWETVKQHQAGSLVVGTYTSFARGLAERYRTLTFLVPVDSKADHLIDCGLRFVQDIKAELGLSGKIEFVEEKAQSTKRFAIKCKLGRLEFIFMIQPTSNLPETVKGKSLLLAATYILFYGVRVEHEMFAVSEIDLHRLICIQMTTTDVNDCYLGSNLIKYPAYKSPTLSMNEKFRVDEIDTPPDVIRKEISDYTKIGWLPVTSTLHPKQNLVFQLGKELNAESYICIEKNDINIWNTVQLHVPLVDENEDFDKLQIEFALKLQSGFDKAEHKISNKNMKFAFHDWKRNEDEEFPGCTYYTFAKAGIKIVFLNQKIALRAQETHSKAIRKSQAISWITKDLKKISSFFLFKDLEIASNYTVIFEFSKTHALVMRMGKKEQVKWNEDVETNRAKLPVSGDVD